VAHKTTRRQLLAALGTGVATLHVPATAVGQTAASESWPGFAYDAANTGYAPENTGPGDGIELDWQYDIGFEVSSSPAVANGTVYVGSTGANELHVIDAATGENN
jgi:outer membrane protein assembly factor BamB